VFIKWSFPLLPKKLHSCYSNTCDVINEKVSEYLFHTIHKADYIPYYSVSVLNEEIIIAQSLLFLIGGFDTSSTLLTYACYELALNQEIQHKLRKEIDGVLGKYGGSCSYEALLDMTYLEMVLLGLFNVFCSKWKLNMNPLTYKSLHAVVFWAMRVGGDVVGYISEDNAASIFTSPWTWRQYGSLKQWYPTTVTTQCHNPEDHDMNHHCENLKSHITNPCLSALGLVNMEFNQSKTFCKSYF